MLRVIVLGALFVFVHSKTTFVNESRTTRRMRTLATATVNLGVVIDLPYDLGVNAVTCNFLTNTYCPVLKDEVVQYTLRMFIEGVFNVGISATVEFQVIDDNNDAIWCIRIPVSITDPLETLHENRMNKTDGSYV